MPLPKPRSVICSPSHIMNIVPAVRVTNVSIINPMPGVGTTSNPLCVGGICDRNTLTPNACIAEIPTVR